MISADIICKHLISIASRCFHGNSRWITYVDAYGRGSADPELLKGFVFPRRKVVTEKAIADALAGLANSGMIRLYKVDGDSFFCFPNWGLHQRIQTKKSRFPEPPEDNGRSRKSTVDHGESPPESESKSESEIPPIPPHEGARGASPFPT